jgi:hypothetical protein
VGGALALVLVVIVLVVAFSGDDEAAPPAPGPPGPPLPSPCNGHACINGDCVPAGDSYSCNCAPVNPAKPTYLWIGDMCDTLPQCAVCGATPYCGVTPNCDPLIPPDPVISELTFNVDIDPADLGPRFERGFARDLGRALEVPADSIIVLSISGGSITVRFAIVPEANFNSTGTGGYSYDPRDKLAALQVMVQDPDSVLFTQSDDVFSEMSLVPTIPSDITDALDPSGVAPAFPCLLARRAPAMRCMHIASRAQHLICCACHGRF